jgi:bifunctional N-acetylglucosamine-1-phosphate-uridyltransferase/glucosamine-1-phosphate-acetyltransferase GlmU-like protein
MIIPAAGAGARLGSSRPKVLVAVGGRALLDHLYALYRRWVDEFVVVVHPSFEEEVRAHCRARRLPVQLALQRERTGMLDAILEPAPLLRERDFDDVWITWCDQVAVRPETVAALDRLCREDPRAALIFPTIRRRRPYIHLVRDEEGEVVEILHEREGDAMPGVGESDMGLFRLSRPAYLDLLPRFAESVVRGAGTGERNFLPFICWLRGRAAVRSVSGHDEIESVGINTREDLRLLEEHLRHG